MNIKASCIIMAGGRGTRFWPLSRAKRPKQLLPMVNNKTLLEVSVDRVLDIFDLKNIHVVTGADISVLTKKVLSSYKGINILKEPLGRNTAPCIGYMSFWLCHYRSPDEVMLIMPSDHIIQPQLEFTKVIKSAIEIASNSDNLITIGIKPRKPHTGYGYIEKGLVIKNIHKNIALFAVDKFHEKPNLINAEKYYSSGKHLWNSGIFVVKAGLIKDKIKQYLPELHKGLSKISKSFGKKNQNQVFVDNFPKLPSESIDYGVIEKMDNILTIEANLKWNDIGSWKSFCEQFGSNNSEYCNTKNHISLESSKNIIYTSDKDKLIVTLGVNNLVIVDTGDVLLISNDDSDQKLRDVVKIIKDKKTNLTII